MSADEDDELLQLAIAESLASAASAAIGPARVASTSSAVRSQSAHSSVGRTGALCLNLVTRLRACAVQLMSSSSLNTCSQTV
jgi:hypothetical protein